VQIVAGVDCHQDTHSIVFLNAVGQLIKELTIETSSEEYQRALKAAAERETFAGAWRALAVTEAHLQKSFSTPGRSFTKYPVRSPNGTASARAAPESRT